MKPRRLSRRGVVTSVVPGCTTIEVSVPCTSCRLGGCSSQGRAPTLLLYKELYKELAGTSETDLRAGVPVEVSVTAHGLAELSLRLLGPPLLWILCYAVLIAPSLSAWRGDWVSELIALSVAVSGLMMALYCGRWLVALSARGLDLDVQNLPARQ